MKNKLAIFEDYKIRRVYDEESETWYFSVIDIIRALLQQPDFQTARNYWKVLKNRLNKEGSESVTFCNRLATLFGQPVFQDFPVVPGGLEIGRGDRSYPPSQWRTGRKQNKKSKIKHKRRGIPRRGT